VLDPPAHRPEVGCPVMSCLLVPGLKLR
jgi:hypothetical protein